MFYKIKNFKKITWLKKTSFTLAYTMNNLKYTLKNISLTALIGISIPLSASREAVNETLMKLITPLTVTVEIEEGPTAGHMEFPIACTRFSLSCLRAILQKAYTIRAQYEGEKATLPETIFDPGYGALGDEQAERDMYCDILEELQCKLGNNKIHGMTLDLVQIMGIINSSRVVDTISTLFGEVMDGLDSNVIIQDLHDANSFIAGLERIVTNRYEELGLSNTRLRRLPKI